MSCVWGGGGCVVLVSVCDDIDDAWLMSFSPYDLGQSIQQSMRFLQCVCVKLTLAFLFLFAHVIRPLNFNNSYGDCTTKQSPVFQFLYSDQKLPQTVCVEKGFLLTFLPSFPLLQL